MVSRRTVVAGIAASLGCGIVDAKFTRAAAAVPSVDSGRLPVVSGPVTGGAKGRPFGSYFGNVEEFGYVEREYFIEGTAMRYRPVGALAEDGLWTVEPAGEVPYKTRIRVLVPRDPTRFNGTVMVEWANVSSGYDISFADPRGLFDGFAYVSVSAQRVGVHGYPTDKPMGLLQWDPERYGSLSIPGDSISYDIYSQAARLLRPGRPRSGLDPLAGLEVRKLIAIGGSQSAARLAAYVNAIQPRDRLFDALMLAVYAGAATNFEDTTKAQAIDPAVRMGSRIPTRLRGLSVPVMVVNSEAETMAYFPVRQPDGPRFRYWEVAGASHGPSGQMKRLDRLTQRDGIARSMGADNLSDVPWLATADAAILHVHNWINGGPPPPRQQRIVVEGTPPAIVRDRYGNARGGVRLPEMDVPIATYLGRDDAKGGAGPLGRTIPFPSEQLRRLYPTHADYVRKVSAAAAAARKRGVLPSYSADEYKARAQAAQVP
ncbi:MAG TPA: alpha/beta hydrolase domain-containing protein [Novosphingobium sp.]|nr:alpha/beta hydrolase domain-containing protein [Novosphingobium sp.]